MPQPLPIYPQLILLDLAAERLAVNAQNTGRLLALTFSAPQYELDVATFKIFQTKVLIRKNLKFTLSLSDKGGQVLGLDHLAIFQD